MNTKLIQLQEEEKIQSLTIFNEEHKQELIKAAPYATIPYMPVTSEFIENYVLNDAEYPLYESKVSQSAIEIKSRINRIVDAQFNIDKLVLEIKELELDIEDIKNSQTKEDRMILQIEKKKLDIKQKKWMINSYKNDSETNFKELVEWKKTLEQCIEEIQKNDPTITDFTKIPYEKIRCAEMELKIRIWKSMKQNGVSLTPSQQLLVGS